MSESEVGKESPDGERTPEDRSGSDGSAPDAQMRRRRFLKALSGVGIAVTGIAVGVPTLTAFVSPALRKPSATSWVKVADDVSTLDVGTPIKVDFVEAMNDAWVESRILRTVWLYTEDGETFTAYSGVCTHLGCSFSFDAEKKQYHCPCHHGIFDMKTGAVVGGPPPRPLDTLPVKVEDGTVFVLYQSFRTGVPDKIEV